MTETTEPAKVLQEVQAESDRYESNQVTKHRVDASKYTASQHRYYSQERGG